MLNRHAPPSGEATATSPQAPAWIRVLRFLFATTIVLQTAIILACVAVEYANEKAGLMQYRLPEFLFWVYVWVGIGAPGSAFAILLILWANRSLLTSATSSAFKRALRHVVALCLVNVCAVALWFAFGGLVFFGAGGSR